MLETLQKHFLNRFAETDSAGVHYIVQVCITKQRMVVRGHTEHPGLFFLETLQLKHSQNYLKTALNILDKLTIIAK